MLFTPTSLKVKNGPSLLHCFLWLDFIAVLKFCLLLYTVSVPQTNFTTLTLKNHALDHYWPSFSIMTFAEYCYIPFISFIFDPYSALESSFIRQP